MSNLRKIQEHIDRLHAATFNTYDLKDVVKYITDKTYLDGQRFSFKNHEFQEQILGDTHPDINVQKCAQVGMSEAMARYALAVCRIVPYFSVIMTMPYSGDATDFVKTRMNPIIDGSPDLKDAINPAINSTEIKDFNGSLLYAKGTQGSTSALSVPADMLIHDELDKSDPHRIGQYQSRLKHSKWKLTRKFGTPTIDGYGIALAMETSMRYKHICKCHHCNHFFLPNYHDNVVIPDFDDDKRQINKDNINKLRWHEAYLICPRCGLQPDLGPEHRQWVCENHMDNFSAKGYYIIPFSVPNVVSIPSLIQESTKYTSWGEFQNQALGETSTDTNEQLILADIMECKITSPLVSSELHYMGCDMGLICHILVGRMTNSGELLVIHKERVIMEKFEEKRRELAQKYRVLITVCDAFPYTDMILRMQKQDQNLYGGVYHDNSSLATYQIKKAGEDQREGKLPINRADIHRNLNFDEVMHLFKERKVVWYADGSITDDTFTKHILDMKRKQDFNKYQEMVYAWVKSNEGQDHFMHALGYLHVACRLRNTVARNLGQSSVPLIKTFKVRQQSPLRA